MIGHFRDESFQTINCKETQHYIPQKHKRETKKNCPS